MLKVWISALLFAGMLAGCGRIDEDATGDGVTYEEQTNPAYNCYSNTPVNGYGECYDSGVLFHGETVDEGVWSIYTQSDENRDDGTIFYDRYQYGFVFNGDGSADKQQKTDGYTEYREWGIDDAGSVLTLSDEGAYTYQAVFSNDSGCLQVSNSGKTIKMCHESFVDQSFGDDSRGYYGANVTFGNRKSYDFVAEGNWTISGYDTNTAATITVELDVNGSTDTGGEWGVSKDGKVIGIDGTRYLVYQYLDGSKSNCIAVFELSGQVTSSTKWELCKE